MTDNVEAYLIYGLVWIGFGLAHSLLASQIIKHKLAHILGPAYRLTYNGFAIITFALVLWIGHQVFAPDIGYTLSHKTKLLLGFVEICGWVFMYFALGLYDMGRFAGTHQIRAAKNGGDAADDEALHTKGLHRYMRHPLYSAAFLILWGGVWSPFGLATAILGSAYLLVGTFFEERRLIARYGSDYVSYQSAVPAFIPWKGRAA